MDVAAVRDSGPDAHSLNAAYEVVGALSADHQAYGSVECSNVVVQTYVAGAEPVVVVASDIDGAVDDGCFGAFEGFPDGGVCTCAVVVAVVVAVAVAAVVVAAAAAADNEGASSADNDGMVDLDDGAHGACPLVRCGDAWVVVVVVRADDLADLVR